MKNSHYIQWEVSAVQMVQTHKKEELILPRFRSSHPKVSLEKGVLKICSKFTGELPCKATLLKSHVGMGVPVDFLHIFRTPFLKNTSGWLLLEIACTYTVKYHISPNFLVLKFCGKVRFPLSFRKFAQIFHKIFAPWN